MSREGTTDLKERRVEEIFARGETCFGMLLLESLEETGGRSKVGDAGTSAATGACAIGVSLGSHLTMNEIRPTTDNSYALGFLDSMNEQV